MFIARDSIRYADVSQLAPAIKARTECLKRNVRRLLRSLLCLAILWIIYQLTLGQGSLLDRHLDADSRADIFVYRSLSAEVPNLQLVNGVYLPETTLLLQQDNFDAAIGRVANAMQLADDGDQTQLMALSNDYARANDAIRVSNRQSVVQDSLRWDRVELERRLSDWLANRKIVLEPLPKGLSDQEVRFVYQALMLQIGQLPSGSTSSHANGSQIRLEISDTGSISDEFYASGLAVGTTKRTSNSTSITLSYVPKANYPIWGMREFEGTIAHEFAHALNLDADTTRTTAARYQDHFASAAAGGLREGLVPRLLGSPSYESLYAQTDASEDAAETYRALALGDVYRPNDARAFTSPLGAKKLQVLAQLEFRYPGITAYMLTLHT